MPNRHYTFSYVEYLIGINITQTRIHPIACTEWTPLTVWFNCTNCKHFHTGLHPFYLGGDHWLGRLSSTFQDTQLSFLLSGRWLGTGWRHQSDALCWWRCYHKNRWNGCLSHSPSQIGARTLIHQRTYQVQGSSQRGIHWALKNRNTGERHSPAEPSRTRNKGNTYSSTAEKLAKITGL